jgi:hypothetical protein
VDAARDPGAMMTAIEQNKRWMIITGFTMIASVAGTLTAIGHMMKWF